MYRRYIKRTFDFVLAAIGLVVLSPLFVLLCIVIKLDSRGMVFFKQKRLKENKIEFYILKFRTMKSDTPANVPTNLLENPDLYITRVGKFLRKSSLDELPQMLNILKGDMSIIGPRPALPNQYNLIIERDKYGANDVRPGLTGLAQISGRDELEDSIKARLDGEYVKKICFTTDVKIFLRTILSVIKSEGVSEGAKEKTCIEESLKL